MRPYPPDTAPMPAPTAPPPATPDEKRLVDAIDLAAGLLERLAREQDAIAVAIDHKTLTTKHEAQGHAAIATTRGEAARALAALVPPLSGDDSIEASEQGAILRGSAPIPSATLRTWAAGWRTLAVSL